ncbi:MAG: SDR family oxidoreductase [Candidatus Sericytochromatia bacterium]
MTFQNKQILITGGNSGIGQATAQLFVEAGAHVLITGRNAATLEATVAAIGDNVRGLQVDTTDLAALDQLAETVKTEMGQLDVLFVNAGVASFAPLEAVDEHFFDTQFNTNVKGAYFTLQKLVPLIKDGGAIVLNASVVPHLAFPGSSVYSATKAALRSFAKSVGAEVLPRGIRVNVVSPGPIETPIYDRLGLDSAQKSAFQQDMTQQVPMKRFGTAQEVAKTVRFLASDDASYISGAEILVDGGLVELR